MPFVQYISSRGVLHYHVTDAPTRTVSIDEVSLPEDKANVRAGSSSSRRRPPAIAAIVVNKRSAAGGPAKMPPSLGNSIIDLTGDSDDDTPKVNARPRLNGHAAASTVRKPPNYLKAAKSSPTTKKTSPRPNNSTRETMTLSRSPITSKASSNNGGHVTGSNSKSQAARASQSSQSSTARKAGDMSQNSSESRWTLPNSKNENAIIISDDDRSDRPSLAEFKMPRGLEDMTLRQPTPSNDSTTSVWNKRKRAGDENSQSPSPLKRSKLASGIIDRGSASASDSASQEVSSKRAGITNGVRPDSSPRRANGLEVNGNERPSATSPLRGKKDSAFLGRERRSDEPVRKEHSGIKRSPERLRDTDSPDRGRNSPNSQRDSLVAGSSTPRSERPASVTKPTGERAKPSSMPEDQPSRREPTQRIRKETEKGQAFSASRKNKSLSGSQNGSPSGRDSGVDARSRTGSDANRSGNESAKAVPQATKVNGQPSSDKGHSAAEIAESLQKRRSGSADRGKLISQSLPSSARDDVDETTPKAKEKSQIGTRRQESSTTLSKDKSKAQDSAPANVEPGTPKSARASRDVDSGAVTSPSRSRRIDKPTPKRSQNADSGRSFTADVRSPQTNETANSSESTSSPSKPSRRDASMEDATTTADAADLQLRSEAMKELDQVTSSTGSKTSFAVPGSAASAMRSNIYSQELPLAAQVEKVLGQYLEELRDDNEYWTSVSMNRARLSKEEDVDRQDPQHEQPTSFANLKPQTLSPYQKGNSSARSDQIWGIEKINPSGRASGAVAMSATYRTFESYVQDVPNYAHYVSIKNNILAPNVTKLICWPYFGDDFDMDEAKNLSEQYHLDIADRERKLLLLLQAQKYEEYVESALEALECTWADVLRFLLEPHPDVGKEPDAQKALLNRHEFCEHDFSRISERWRSILTELPPSTPDKLARAAVLCDNFQKMAKFSLWHVARRSEYARLSKDDAASEEKALPDNELTCRICLCFNCPYHGELKEQPDSESDDESVASVVATDIVHPPRANYRSRVAIPPPHGTNEDAETVSGGRNDNKKDPKFWRHNEYNHLPDERGPFYPCHHPGVSCEDAQCSCYADKLPCEKICSCAPDCKRKFQGCLCSMIRYKSRNKGPCFEDERCACYQLGRECDPDLCGDCGVCEVVDPVNRHSDSILSGRCRNCSIQLGIPKHTLLGDSGIHGLGLYACELIKENDFVGEYKGEIITKEEAERRGAVYEHQKLSYLFSLNMSQEIDSTNFGNKVRFINHAKDKANLYPRIIMVNTVHRIALYASCTIRPGQELLFDYGPKFPDEQLGGKKSKKSAPHVRNAELVRNFLEVEESKDEVGNVRAKGVAYPTNPRNRARGKKPRGGARANAGRKLHVQRARDGSVATSVFTPQDAGERLTNYNILDDPEPDLGDENAGGGVEEDEFEIDEVEDSESEEYTEATGSSASDDDEEDEDDELVGRQGRGGIGTRRTR